MLAIILNAVSILVILFLPLRSYFIKLVYTTVPLTERSRKLLNQLLHCTLLSLRKEHMNLGPTTYKGMLLRVIYTAR